MSDIKCPVCDSYLHKIPVKEAWVCGTHDTKDKLYGSKELWQELIRTHKALELALAELQEIDGCCEDNKYADNVYVGLDGHDTHNIALDVKKTIAEITALTKGGNNE